jgi:hypothetical protein
VGEFDPSVPHSQTSRCTEAVYLGSILDDATISREKTYFLGSASPMVAQWWHCLSRNGTPSEAETAGSVHELAGVQLGIASLPRKNL